MQNPELYLKDGVKVKDKVEAFESFFRSKMTKY
jgi:hypothetical protein